MVVPIGQKRTSTAVELVNVLHGQFSLPPMVE
jgi:hypothetical protein